MNDIDIRCYCIDEAVKAQAEDIVTEAKKFMLG